MTKIKAVLFDLHWTLAYVRKEDEVTSEELSDYLFSRGYEVSPQQLRAAWMFVAFVDYPKHGYKSWRSYFRRILWRLKVKVDHETLETIVKRLENRPYLLQWDAAEAVKKAKKQRFKTAIVTTIAYFQFKKAIEPIKEYFDCIMTGYEAECDKTNPKMYKKVLEILNVKPEETVMIGDDVQVDILLPKRLGIRAILLDRDKKKPECPQADAIVNNLNEAIENIIRKFTTNKKPEGHKNV
ncbi:MAG: HAD-IA family hydrolase [Candidatus Bathyarchaeota archaeon]|nr:HAD-IA family hydrolase [Candidatus Bathyarchaeota archaeon A05DMB-5]MDH7558026.1 HAD-IA family hydrolase [Candidatus Bathyarchaeota archaeon]